MNKRFSFQPNPSIETPQTAWAGPVCISYWPKQGLLNLEAWAFRNGERRVTRSFTFRKQTLAQSPEAVALIQRALQEFTKENNYSGGIQ